MIDVHYFASIRERLGRDTDRVELPSGGTVVDLIDALVTTYGADHARVLKEGRVLVAINQDVRDLHAPVADGDEVAFFPPVTGG